jgi:hypothetical protein
MLPTEHLFWLVAFALYFYENLRLCGNESVLTRESFTGRFVPMVSNSPIIILGKELYLLNLFAPHSAFLKLPKKLFENPKDKFLEDTSRAEAFIKQLLPLRWIATINFTYLLIGVFLTHIYGISTAFLVLLPAHLTLLITALITLVWKRKKLNLSVGQVSSIFFETLVVPSYLSALVKKVCEKQDFTCDGYLFTLADKSILEAYRNKILENLNMIRDEFDLTDSQYRRIDEYKLAIGLCDEQQ